MKSWFLSRNNREKILVILFCLIGVGIWVSGAAKRASAQMRELKAARSSLETQQVWLDNRQSIETAADEAVKNLDPEKTYSSTNLVAEVMALANKSGLSVNTDSPRSQKANQFSFNTVQVTSRRSDFGAVVRFYQELAKRAPYLALEQITLQSDKGAPGMVNVNFQIASVELIRSAE